MAQLLGAGAGAANGLVLDYLNHLREQPLLGHHQPAPGRPPLDREAGPPGRPGDVVDRGERREAKAKALPRDTRGPGMDGVRRLLAVSDRAIVRLLFDVALGRGELVGLDLEHVDLEAGDLCAPGARAARTASGSRCPIRRRPRCRSGSRFAAQSAGRCA